MRGHLERSRQPRRRAGVLAAFGVVVAVALLPAAQRAVAPVRIPGYVGDGVTLLPNGWKIAPVGRHLPVGDLPMGIALSPDGRFLAITTNGFDKPALMVFDTRTQEIAQRVPIDHTWLGVVWQPDGKGILLSGSSENLVYRFRWEGGRLSAAGTISLAEPEKHGGMDVIEHAGYVAGIAINRDGSRLYTTQIYGQTVHAVDVATGQVVHTAELPAEPYTCVLSPDGRTLYVSLWGGAKVLMFDADTLAPTGTVDVGEHPNAMVVSRDGARLFVACANTNAVWVVDLASKAATEQISSALDAHAPVGTTPNGLALSPDGATLLVANADNNTVTVADVSKPGGSRVRGWVPVGWYPTNVIFDRDGSRFYVLNAKGLYSGANPRGSQPGGYRADGQYSGNMMQGTISMVPVPTDAMLARWTSTVRALTPYSDRTRLAPADAPRVSPIPRQVGGTSPIKYVFYVIRENRTYDQVLGDVPKANGDPRLALFGKDITPNAHALVENFTTFDNFYVDAEVSYDGHAFSTGAYATDFVEKMWPPNYGRREGLYLSEGGYRMRNAFGNIAAPPQGYIWDFARRAGVSYRSYGEFVGWQGENELRASVPGLDGHISPKYPPFNLRITDNSRIDVFTDEFRAFEKSGTMPRLSVIRLGNDHTNGTAPGSPTPRSYVAENDLALGRLVDLISHSSIWKESAIFVLEDDAQNGPDHVDAHRSVLVVASPFTRRHFVDSTLYTTSGVLRTMELILGLPPMSQYDAAATPLYNAFQPTPDAAPFAHLDARYPLDEKNDWSSPGAAASLRMDFADADMAPDLELNQILWQSVHGRGAVMPPPRRTGFIASIGDGDGDDR